MTLHNSLKKILERQELKSFNCSYPWFSSSVNSHQTSCWKDLTMPKAEKVLAVWAVYCHHYSLSDSDSVCLVILSQLCLNADDCRYLPGSEACSSNAKQSVKGRDPNVAGGGDVQETVMGPSRASKRVEEKHF